MQTDGNRSNNYLAATLVRRQPQQGMGKGGPICWQSLFSGSQENCTPKLSSFPSPRSKSHDLQEFQIFGKSLEMTRVSGQERVEGPLYIPSTTASILVS